MSPRRTVFLPLLLAVLALFAQPLAGKTVTLRDADNHTAVALNLGDTLVITLQSMEPRDYRWQAHLAATAQLTALNEMYIPPANSNSGIGTYTFRFNATSAGKTTLALGFEKQAKTGPAPQTTSTYRVEVSITSGEPGTDESYIGRDILIAVYKGTLPCADCAGLDTELRLYAKGKFDTSDAFFVRTQTYRDAPKGDRTYADRGEWLVIKGDAVTPDATVYQLILDDPARSEYLLLQGDTLTQLDRDQRPIQTTMNLSLHRAR